MMKLSHMPARRRELLAMLARVRFAPYAAAN